MNMRRLAAITITLMLSGFPGCYALELAGDADPGGDLFMADSDADAEAGADIDAEADENGEPCVPVTEECNGRDDDCDGAIDEDFGLGLPCDGPDADLCLDDVMTCDGCTTGPDMVETCDCADNDCDGAVDEGCEDRVCVVTLTVLRLDYPGHCWVDVPPVGSSDVVTYACTGSDVRFVFGDIVFTGLVTGCWIDVHARTTFPWSDGCDWETSQSIVGELLPGRLLDYTYREAPIPGQTGCVYSCDASGVIRVQ
ncbi:MAG: hypothetical protein ABIJ56_02290 [Pseudomonadota bacterium]